MAKTTSPKCPACFGSGKLQDPKKVGERMKKLRQKAEITSAAVAEAMGVSMSYVSDLENGKRNWNLELVEKYKAATGIQHTH